MNALPVIKKLPDFVINVIKAGEVIERPCNMLKELLENSLDAHSNKIEIQLVNNGLDFFSIKDNGCGIAFDQLPNAFLRHQTSKLFSVRDLQQLETYGFRGEALASIACISKMKMHSLSGQIHIQANKILEHKPLPVFINTKHKKIAFKRTKTFIINSLLLK